VLLTAVPLLRVFLVRSPVAYHPEGSGRGTATLKFYEGRDNLVLWAELVIALVAAYLLIGWAVSRRHHRQS
jgi:hypothetical protein